MEAIFERKTTNGDPRIRIYSGKFISLVNPLVSDIQLVDIAHHLSNICRFTGSTITLYSVAQHSVAVSKIVSPENALWGLLHDASEAYLGDVSSPLKYYLNGKYRELEDRFMSVICEKFGLPPIEPEEVYEADKIMYVTERRDLMVVDGPSLDFPHKPLDERIRCWEPLRAKYEFLERFTDLYLGDSGWREPNGV